MSFDARVRHLPTLGIGVSTEYGAGDCLGGLDIPALRRANPGRAAFLELGTEVAKGFDRHADAWIASGAPTTYHFLDVNLDEREDLDARWLDGVAALTARAQPAWLCGDAGLWHVGRRERGHMLLLPPVLTHDTARAMAPGIAALRAHTRLEVLPENPPGAVYVGDLHLMDFFARLCEEADTGMLLDAAHLAIYQRSKGLPALAGLDGFPLERLVEIHIAGARVGSVDGYAFVDDDHTPEVLPETWEILRHVAPRAPNLRAIVVECERNPLGQVGGIYERIEALVAGSPFDGRRRAGAPPTEGPATMPGPLPWFEGSPPRQAVQRAVVRMLHDPGALGRIAAEGALAPEELAWLRAVDPRAWRTDPYRAARVMTGLVEEYPAGANAVGADLRAFFGGARYHAAVREGTSLADALGAWLADLAPAAVRPVVEVERAIAAGRRADTTEGEPPGDMLVRSPRCAVVTGPVPAPYACEGDALVTVGADGLASVEEASDGLTALLRAAEAPVARDALLVAARDLGAEPGEDEEIVDGLIADGLLVPA